MVELARKPTVPDFKSVEEAYCDLLAELFPTGLNPPELLPGTICRKLDQLDHLEKYRTFQIVTADPPPTKEELLLREIRQLVRMGGRRIGKHPHHRHPI